MGDDQLSRDIATFLVSAPFGRTCPTYVRKNGSMSENGGSGGCHLVTIFLCSGEGRVKHFFHVSKKKIFVVPNVTQFYRKYKRHTVNRHYVAIECQISEDK